MAMKENPFMEEKPSTEEDLSLEERIRRFMEELARISPEKPMVEITPYRGETTVFSSKFGGVPYFPKDMEYPAVREGGLAGKPIRFLAQLNFAEIPHMEGFPTDGILQFFVGCDGDDVYGLDFDDPLSQNAFRVIYHEKLIDDGSRLCGAEDMPVFEDDDYPFEGEFALKFSEKKPSFVSMGDYQFDRFACEAYNRAFGGNIQILYGPEDSMEDADPELYDALLDGGLDDDEVIESLSCDGSHVGGYPYFTQSDPREYEAAYQKCDTVLLQIDTGDEIMWGDSGVANFFIPAEDLAKKDFSRVLYNWDCC